MAADTDASRLGDYVEQRDLGETFAAETGFLIRQNPDTVRALNVAFVSHARLGDVANHPGYLPLAPDLVAEVVSPNDRSSDVEEKVLVWLAARVSAVLVVDPRTKSIRHDRSADEIQVHTEGEVDLGHVINEFQLDVSEQFS